MEKETLIHRLKSKPDLDRLMVEAIENTAVLDALFEMVLTETSSVKYVCTKIIRMVSEQKPECIYPRFEDVSRWIHHKNSFVKWDGIMTLSNLAAVDEEDKFVAIYSDYFTLMEDPRMITASQVIGNAWKIVLAKPEWEGDITRRLLEVPGNVYLNKGGPSPECNRIACGHVLECFEHYYDVSGDQAAMCRFAKGQLGSCRKSAVKKAEDFLRRHSC